MSKRTPEQALELMRGFPQRIDVLIHDSPGLSEDYVAGLKRARKMAVGALTGDSAGLDIVDDAVQKLNTFQGEFIADEVLGVMGILLGTIPDGHFQIAAAYDAGGNFDRFVRITPELIEKEKATGYLTKNGVRPRKREAS